MTSGFKLIFSFCLTLLFSASLLIAQDTQKKMSINVLDPATGGGLEGAKITWQTYGTTAAASDRGTINTGSDGSAIIPLPGKGMQVFQIAISHPGFVGLRASWPDRSGRASEQTNPQTEPPAVYEVTMEPVHAISGKVVDEKGEPVNGATVVVSMNKKLGAPNTSLDISWKNIKTGSDGTFKFDSGPSSADSAELGCFHTDYSNNAHGYYSMEKYDSPQKLIDGTAVITLPHGVTVEGTITDPDGKPIAGAKVGWGTDRVATNVLPEVTTDSQGKYRFGAQPNITATLTVKGKGFAPDLKTVEVGTEKATLDFQLKQGKTLTAKVIVPAGTSLAGGYVYIDSWRGARTLNQQIKLGADGTFTWKDAPEDEVLVDVLVRGTAPKRRVKMKAGDQMVTVNLSEGMNVHGKVIDAETGKPIPTFNITRGYQYDPNNNISWQRQERTPGTNGDFTLKLMESYAFYAVRIDADGYKRSISRSISQDEKNVELEFKLEKGKYITGIVKDPDGKPVAGAQVKVATASQPLYVQFQYQDRGPNDSAVTDDAGKYSLPEQIEPYMLLAMSDNGYAKVPQKEIEKSSDIQLNAWSKIEGTFIKNSKPGPNELIMMGTNDEYIEKAPRITFDFRGKTDENGDFEFSKLPAGEYWVSRYQEINAGMYSTSTNTHTERVKVEAGKSTTVQLGGKGRPVTGKLSIPADKLKSRPWVAQMGFIQTPPPFDEMEIYNRTKGMSDADRTDWYKKWQASDEGKEYTKKSLEYQKIMMNYSVLIAKDGTFRAECIPAGKFQLSLSIAEAKANQHFGGNMIAFVRKAFEVPEIPGAYSDEPLDLGSIELDWSQDQAK